MLEIAVLGLLNESPMHGYELRKRLSSLLGTFRAFSYGSLYPTLRRLSEAGWISEEEPIDATPESLHVCGPALPRSQETDRFGSGLRSIVQGTPPLALFGSGSYRAPLGSAGIGWPRCRPRRRLVAGRRTRRRLRHERTALPRTLHDLTELGAIGLDNEVDRQAVGGPCLGWTSRPRERRRCSKPQWQGDDHIRPRRSP